MGGARIPAPLPHATYSLRTELFTQAYQSILPLVSEFPSGYASMRMIQRDVKLILLLLLNEIFECVCIVKSAITTGTIHLFIATSVQHHATHASVAAAAASEAGHKHDSQQSIHSSNHEDSQKDPETHYPSRSVSRLCLLKNTFFDRMLGYGFSASHALSDVGSSRVS